MGGGASSLFDHLPLLSHNTSFQSPKNGRPSTARSLTHQYTSLALPPPLWDVAGGAAACEEGVATR